MASDCDSLNELQWAHQTLMRLIVIVQRNGFVNDRLRGCLIHMSQSAVSLEGLIQDHLVLARRRRSDAQGE